MSSLLEIDGESNKISDSVSVLNTILAQPDLLVLTLTSSPLMEKVTSADAFFKALSSEESQHEEIKKKLKYYCRGSMYRSKRVFDRINDSASLTKRSSNFSNGSSSCCTQTNPAMSSPILSQKVAKSQRYEEMA